MNFESEKGDLSPPGRNQLLWTSHFCCKYLYKILYACDCNVDFDIN